jgi:hypothetical protein
MERELRSDLPTAASPPVPAEVGWRVVLAGLGAAAAAVAIGQVTIEQEPPNWAVAVRVLLVLAALILAGLAVRWRWREWPWYAAAATTALVGYFGLPESWDSGRLVAAVLCGVSLFGMALVLLPPLPRKIVISACVLVHFGGILTAVTSPGPGTPYLTQQFWTRLYRPYLQFLYLNNAYHFYSPEPGPASLLWFCVKYDDGTPDFWYKVPRRPEDVKDPLAVEYYRRLSLTEQTAQCLPPSTWVTPFSLAARQQIAVSGDPARKVPRIPMHPLLDASVQRRVPDERPREHVIPAFIRFVARHAPNPEHVRAIKLYRLEHRILNPDAYSHGASPYDPSLYNPYYQGEFKPDGRLADPTDPLLYWIIPVTQELKKGVEVKPGTAAAWDPDNFVYTDYLTIHAGSYHGGF